MMAMMMAGRVLLVVCALCVLWCGAGWVYAKDLDNNAQEGCVTSGELGTNCSHMPRGCNKPALMMPLRSVLSVAAVEASNEQEDSKANTGSDLTSGDRSDTVSGTLGGTGVIDGSKVDGSEPLRLAVVPPDNSVGAPPPPSPDADKEPDDSLLPKVVPSSDKNNPSEKIVHSETALPAGTALLNDEASKESLPTVKPAPNSQESTGTVKTTERVSEENPDVLQGPDTVNAGQSRKKTDTEIKPHTTTATTATKAPTTTTTTTTTKTTTTAPEPPNTTTTKNAPTTTTTRAPSRLRRIDGSLSSSAWVCAPLLLAASALAYTAVN
ncbi:hypothetical protein ECC02_007905 [Trypanosoma cruzi]|uniref:Mucin TcMUCII n=1 Tax=Trypanosoma cruzi TaxID=5693 RepID=A0A7J6XXI2_TRYCR|nr:hypothetical protein ECC02_007905 [Trypanosoma cruzi]